MVNIYIILQDKKANIFELSGWTPILAGSIVSGDHTYVTQIGQCFKIDSYVLLSFFLQWSSFDSNTSGAIRLRGLPFGIRSVRTANAIAEISGINLSGGNPYCWGYGGGIELTLSYTPSNTPITLEIAPSNINVSGFLSGSVNYIISG